MTPSAPESPPPASADNCCVPSDLADTGKDTDLPQVLAAWRKIAGLKIAGAAARAGVSPAAWGHWEKGSRFPNARNLAMLAAFTGLSIRALLCAHHAQCPFRRHDPPAGPTRAPRRKSRKTR